MPEGGEDNPIGVNPEGEQGASQRILDTGLGQAALDLMKPKLVHLGLTDVKAEECTFSLRPGRSRATSVSPDPELSIRFPGGTQFFIHLKPSTQESDSGRRRPQEGLSLRVTDAQNEVVSTILEGQAKQ